MQAPKPAPVLWLTGLSGSGKTTLARALEQALREINLHAFVLDGDQIRCGLSADLGFSAADRSENIRRIGEAAKLLSQAGVIAIVAAISPLATDRANARRTIGNENFIEIYCNAPLEVCEQRDVKGLYKRARTGELADFTGVSSPYQAPQMSDVVCETGLESVEVCVKKILTHLSQKRL